MGTRGLIGFRLHQQLKASYNHYDSHPNCLGAKVAEFITKVNAEHGWETLKANVAKVMLVEEDSKPTADQVKKYKKFSNTEVSTRTLNDWYCLLRELQGEGYLNAIYEGTCLIMLDGNDFIKDSLYCEFAYILDVDAMRLEFYLGFQKAPDPTSPYGVEHDDSGYYPCRLATKIPFDQFTDVDAIVKQMETLHEDERDRKEKIEADLREQRKTVRKNDRIQLTGTEHGLKADTILTVIEVKRRGNCSKWKSLFERGSSAMDFWHDSDKDCIGDIYYPPIEFPKEIVLIRLRVLKYTPITHRARVRLEENGGKWHKTIDCYIEVKNRVVKDGDVYYLGRGAFMADASLEVKTDKGATLLADSKWKIVKHNTNATLLKV